MEPQKPKVSSMFSHELARSLEENDSVTLVEQLTSLREENTPTAMWAEAVGTRLQIRDFLVQQKGGLAALHSSQGQNMRENVANYLHGIDTGLTILTGDYGQDMPPATPQQLKEARLGRLTQEPAEKLLRLISGFSTQDSDAVLSASDLIDRTIAIRHDIVERLWTATQSYNEGFAMAAAQELDIEMTAVNDSLNNQISTILVWDENA